MDTVTITHEYSAKGVKTTVTLPGKKPITKRWEPCEGGFVGKFKTDWIEDRRLEGWSEVAEAAEDNHSEICIDL